jgi:hypothetical protein
MFERVGEQLRCRQDYHEHQRKLQEEQRHAALRNKAGTQATQWT